jgi:homoserine kinase type II
MPDRTATDAAAAEVLARYPAAMRPTALEPLGNRGGFSGAHLWRGVGPAGPLGLRAWPPGQVEAEQLHVIHRWMNQARAAGIDVVPEVLGTLTGATWVEHTGRLWELTRWMPGRADFHEHPTAARLEAALATLGRLHRAWAVGTPVVGPCPAVRRRLRTWQQWNELLKGGWQPAFQHSPPEIAHRAELAWHLVRRHADLPARLAPWLDRPVPLQPCLCDVWHDHLLFEGDVLTGLVDYGGMKIDHVAVDLARLVGSLVGDDAPRRTLALDAYRQQRPLSCDEDALVHDLDQSGTFLGAVNWLRWLYHDRRHFDDPAAVARRLAALVTRMQQW